jgi:hypothetical protein
VSLVRGRILRLHPTRLAGNSRLETRTHGGLSGRWRQRPGCSSSWSETS